MKRIIVIGCPGSGKSTFSRSLHRRTGIPLCHLDLLFWNSDQTTVEKSVFLDRLSAVMQKNTWIIDGNYASTMELRLQACDTVIFLDYPLEVCLRGVRERQGKSRSDMPWIETESDTEFMAFIQNFSAESRPQIMELLAKYPDKTIRIFKDRTESDDFLSNI